jgi:hypothetical protein
MNSGYEHIDKTPTIFYSRVLPVLMTITMTCFSSQCVSSVLFDVFLAKHISDVFKNITIHVDV